MDPSMPRLVGDGPSGGYMVQAPDGSLTEVPPDVVHNDPNLGGQAFLAAHEGWKAAQGAPSLPQAGLGGEMVAQNAPQGPQQPLGATQGPSDVSTLSPDAAQVSQSQPENAPITPGAPAPVVSPKPTGSPAMDVALQRAQAETEKGNATIARDTALGNLETQQARQAKGQLALNEAGRFDAVQTLKRDLAKNDQEWADLANSKVDPNKVWHDKSTGSKVLSILGLMAGGFYAGFSGTGKNPAQEALDKEIENDINAQKTSIENKRSRAEAGLNRYKMNLADLHDEEAAKNVTFGQYQQLQGQTMKALADRMQNPITAAAMREAAAQRIQEGIDNVDAGKSKAMTRAVQKSEIDKNEAAAAKDLMDKKGSPVDAALRDIAAKGGKAPRELLVNASKEMREQFAPDGTYLGTSEGVKDYQKAASKNAILDQLDRGIQFAEKNRVGAFGTINPAASSEAKGIDASLIDAVERNEDFKRQSPELQKMLRESYGIGSGGIGGMGFNKLADMKAARARLAREIGAGEAAAGARYTVKKPGAEAADKPNKAPASDEGEGEGLAAWKKYKAEHMK